MLHNHIFGGDKPWLWLMHNLRSELQITCDQCRKDVSSPIKLVFVSFVKLKQIENTIKKKGFFLIKHNCPIARSIKTVRITEVI